MAHLIRKTVGAIASAAVVLVLLLAAGCTSGFEWILGVDVISPEMLQRSLQAGGKIQIIDVGPEEAYMAGHIPGALRVDINELESRLPLLSLNRDALTVFTCPGGHLSAMAVVMAKGQHFSNAVSLNGGVSQWRRRGFETETGSSPAMDMVETAPALVPISFNQQLATVVSGLGFKPVYMALTLMLCIGLWKNRARGITLIRWGLAAFFAGEMFCALNYLVFSGGSNFFDTLHGLGMVVMGVLVSWGLTSFLDERVLHVAAAKSTCAFKRLCKTCWKYETVPCRLQRIVLFAAPALAVVSLMPWCLPLRSLYRVSDVFGTAVLYSYSPVLQLTDFRLYSFLAAVLFLFTAMRLLKRGVPLETIQPPFFAGMGFMSFSLFRFFLLETYRVSPAWMDFWEETTELIMILGLGWFLFQYRTEAGLWPFKKRGLSQPAPDEEKA